MCDSDIQPTVVVVGSCMVDLIAGVERLPGPGETVAARGRLARGAGGKGANQCVAAQRLGANTALIARVGTDNWSDWYVNLLIKEGVHVNNVRFTDGEDTGIALIAVDTKGENQIVVVPGANERLCEQDIYDVKDQICGARVVILQLETPLQTALATLRLCVSSKTISILNGAPALAPADVSNELFTIPDVFCVNETEAGVFCDLPESTDGEELARALLARGCRSVLVTLGSRGAVYCSQESPDPQHMPAPCLSPQQVVDTTGAGDAFIGALAYLLAHQPHLNMDKSIVVACHLAAISVQKSGTQISFPDKSHLQDIFKQLNIQLQ